jgi:hypothetical protein
MKEVKVKLGTMSAIHRELYGNPILKTEGLLKSALSLKAKYTLHIIAVEFEKHLKFVEAQQKELLEKYGTKDDNGRVLYAIETISPDYEKYEEEMTEVLEIEHSVSLPEMSIDIFDGVKTDEYYPSLFNLIIDINK